MSVQFEPFKIGKYLMLRLIGRGGMAEVYLAKTEGAGRFEKKFAAKRLLSPFCDDPQFVGMFEQEANLFSVLDHPNIAQVYDFLYLDGTYLLVMEYIEGSTAGQVMPKLATLEDFPRAAVAAFLISEVLKGLEYAHQKKDEATGQPLAIIHRDISPQNIMVTRNGVVKIIDFGIARTGVSQSLTRPGTIKGKIGYSSPEQLEGHDLDYRTDIYSSAVVLYEFLTGRHLFEADTEGGLIRKIIQGELPDFSSDPSIPPGLAPVLRSALALDPQARMASAQEFYLHLEHFLQNEYNGFNQSHAAALCQKALPMVETGPEERSRSGLSGPTVELRGPHKEENEPKTALLDLGVVTSEVSQETESLPTLSEPNAPNEESPELVTRVMETVEDEAVDRASTRLLDTPDFAQAAEYLGEVEPGSTGAPPAAEEQTTGDQAVEAPISPVMSNSDIHPAPGAEAFELVPPRSDGVGIEDSDPPDESDMDFWATRVRARMESAHEAGENPDVDHYQPWKGRAEDAENCPAEPLNALVKADEFGRYSNVLSVPGVETSAPFVSGVETGPRTNKVRKGLNAVLGLALIVFVCLIAPRIIPNLNFNGTQEASVAKVPASDAMTVSQQCLLTLTTDPPVAEVYLNDRRTGQTPSVVRVPCLGNYTLRIEQEGYIPVVRQVNAGENLDKWYVSLHKASVGQVEIWMDFNASLFIDDVPKGQITSNQTFKLLLAANQTHRLRIKNEVLGIDEVRTFEVGTEKVLTASLFLSDLLGTRQVKN